MLERASEHSETKGHIGVQLTAWLHSLWLPKVLSSNPHSRGQNRRRNLKEASNVTWGCSAIAGDCPGKTFMEKKRGKEMQ